MKASPACIGSQEGSAIRLPAVSQSVLKKGFRVYLPPPEGVLLGFAGNESCQALTIKGAMAVLSLAYPLTTYEFEGREPRAAWASAGTHTHTKANYSL